MAGAGAGSAQGVASGFLEVGDGRIHYEAAGDGVPVVFLHDGLTYSAIWDAQFRALAGRFRAVRYDRRGYGRSTVPTGPYSPIDDLQALLDHLGIERAVLVGASSGGSLALDYLLAHPDRVSRLVLVGAVVSGYGFSDHFLERGRRNMAPLANGDVESTVANWVADRYLIAPENAEARKRLLSLMESHARKRFLGYAPELARPAESPALGRLSEIDIPVLVIVGSEDIPDVHAHAGAIEAGIKGARRIVVPRSGHLVAFERPHEFNRLLVDFLESR